MHSQARDNDGCYIQFLDGPLLRQEGLQYWVAPAK